MKSRLFFAFALFALPYALVEIGHAQVTTWQDARNRSDIQIGYNKFEDYTIVITKRMVVDGVVGKGSLMDPYANQRTMEIAAAFAHSGQSPKTPIDAIAFGFYPKASTKFGKIFQTLESDGDSKTFYISPNAKVIAIADGKRFDFGVVEKTGSLNVWGDYFGNAFVLIPVETFKQLVTAKKLEMALGEIEIKLKKRDVERLRRFWAELDERMR